MKIALLSPCKTSGTTLITALIAAAYGITQEADAIVTFTSDMSKRICEYTGSEIKEDITASATQMYSLIMADSVNKEDCKDYMTIAGPHMYLLDTATSSLTLDERISLMRKIFEFDAAPLTLCDINTSMNIHKDELVEDIINNADTLWIVVNTDLKSVEKFKEWVDIGFITKDTKFKLLVNNFDERAYSIYQISAMFGVRTKNILTVHRSPYIQKYTNEGKLSELILNIVAKEPPVFELNNDLEKICKTITEIAGTRFKWG